MNKNNETTKMEFYNAKDIAAIVSCSRATAYRTIDRLNHELEKKGFFTFSGKVSKKYFHERMYI